MHCFPQIPGLLLALVIGVAFANPINKTHGHISGRAPPDADDGSDFDLKFSALVNPTREFYLKTRVIASNDKTNDGLYVDTYHIGAGQNAAVLVKEARLFAFFNGPSLQIESYTSTWNLNLNDHYTYDGWVPVLINPSTPHTNFVLDNNKLISLNPIFQGWLVCNWALGQPQLFRYTDRYDLYNFIPSTCVSVDLVAEDRNLEAEETTDEEDEGDVTTTDEEGDD